MISILVAALLLFQSTQQPARPTEPTDPMPPPNMDYFVGTWSFDWNVPESPLGPGGKMQGTETYKKILSGQVYESDIKGEGPEGPFTGRAITSYDEKEKIVSRYEIFSYGVSAFKSGTIGGDLGGYYTIYWESSPFKKNGHVFKLKGKTQMLSPAHYKLQVEISVDGGPFTSYGNPWFRKVDAKSQS
jgi:hypothetical protein